MKAPPSFPNPRIHGWPFHGGVPQPTIFYRIMRRIFQVTMSAFWKIRIYNRHYEPSEGGVVYICNHQSFFDPILMSFALRRPVNFMARDSLFRIPIFGPSLNLVHAFPVKRGTADTGALKEAMRRLKNGGQVVLFAEGTRTHDGKIGKFLPGFALLAQKAAKWVVPVVIDGAYEAWPRQKALPGPGKIVVQYAKPISQQEIRKMKSEQLVKHLRGILIDMQNDIRRRVGREVINYD